MLDGEKENIVPYSVPVIMRRTAFALLCAHTLGCRPTGDPKEEARRESIEYEQRLSETKAREAARERTPVGEPVTTRGQQALCEGVLDNRRRFEDSLGPFIEFSDDSDADTDAYSICVVHRRFRPNDPVNIACRIAIYCSEYTNPRLVSERCKERQKGVNGNLVSEQEIGAPPNAGSQGVVPDVACVERSASEDMVSFEFYDRDTRCRFVVRGPAFTALPCAQAARDGIRAPARPPYALPGLPPT